MNKQIKRMVPLLFLLTLASTAQGEDCAGLLQVQNLYDQHTMKECMLPMLFADWKHMTEDQWKSYCQLDSCKTTVHSLQQLPACTWQKTDDEAVRMGIALLQLCSDKQW